MDILKDYDISLHYHSGKANIVAGALSRLSMGSLSHVEEGKKEMVKDIHRLVNLGVRLLDSKDGGLIVHELAKSYLCSEVKEKQDEDPTLMQIKKDVGQQKVMSFEIGGDGILRFQGRLCVSNVDRLRERILDEAHTLRYVVHLGSTMMYHDLKTLYWWNNMKLDVADFLSKCLNCQQVKVEHMRPGGTSQEIALPLWKWEMINMDFIIGLLRSRNQYDSIWMIVDRLTKSAHFLPVRTNYSGRVLC